jgi:hypothetical protein
LQHLLQHSGPVNVECSIPSLLSVATSAATPSFPLFSPLQHLLQHALSTSSAPFPFLSLLQHPGQGPVERSIPSLLSVATSAATLRPCRRRALPSLFCLSVATRALLSAPFPLFVATPGPGPFHASLLSVATPIVSDFR